MSTSELDYIIAAIARLPLRACQYLMRQLNNVQSFALIGRPQDILHDGRLHGSDVTLKHVVEEHLDLEGERCEEVVWHVVKSILHPLFLVLRELVVADAVRVVDVVKHAMNTDIDLLEKLFRPYFVEIEADRFSG